MNFHAAVSYRNEGSLLDADHPANGVLFARRSTPALFARFCEVFTQEVNRLRMEGRANVAAAEAEIRKIDRELETLLDLILKGGAADKINTKMVGLEQRKKEVEAFLAEADEPPPLLHPSMAQLYRSRVQGLYDALQGEDEEKRTEAADIIRTLVEDIGRPSVKAADQAASR
jgi:site-specific DNA recombinase